MNKLDCLLIGYKELTLEERRLMAKGNMAALNYCKHEYICYNDKMLFYDDFLTQISHEVNGTRYKISELPYLGIMYLDNYLRNRGISVSTYNNFDFDKNLISEELEKERVLVIAISAVFYTSPIPLIRLVKYFRKKSPESLIVVGGAYISNEYDVMSREMLISEFKMIGADIYIYDAQGEQALYSIISDVKLGKSYKDVPNIIENVEGRLIVHKHVKEKNDINCNVINYKRLGNRLQFSTLNVRTARGCPNRCRFCNYPVRNPRLELQTYQNIEKQIKELYEMDSVKNIVFIDDSFNIPLERFKEICKRMISHGAKKPWYSYFRMSHCDEETVKLMKMSNCQGVFLGVESADNKVLSNMNKKTSVEQYISSLELLHKYSIMTFAYFMIGFPGETQQTVEKNIELLNSKKIDFYSLNLWYAERNTPIFKYKDEFELEGDGFKWKHYSMDSIEASHMMDYIYENVNESIYIPSENFSFWGVPYLLGKGLEIESVKCILKQIREYILDSNKDRNQSIEKIRSILKEVT